MDDEQTVGQLLARFPNGFTVSALGTISRIITGSSHLPAIASRWPLAPPGGGYLVVDSDVVFCSECGKEVAECKCHER